MPEVPDEEHCRPETGLSTIHGMRTGVDCGQDQDNADSSQAKHEDEPIEGALYFAANELEERHYCNAVGSCADAATSGQIKNAK